MLCFPLFFSISTQQIHIFNITLTCFMSAGHLSSFNHITVNVTTVVDFNYYDKCEQQFTSVFTWNSEVTVGFSLLVFLQR